MESFNYSLEKAREPNWKEERLFPAPLPSLSLSLPPSCPLIRLGSSLARRRRRPGPGISPPEWKEAPWLLSNSGWRSAAGFVKSCKIAAWVQRSAGPGSAARPGKDGWDLLRPATQRPAGSLAFIIPPFFFLFFFFSSLFRCFCVIWRSRWRLFPNPLELFHLFIYIVWCSGNGGVYSVESWLIRRSCLLLLEIRKPRCKKYDYCKKKTKQQTN